MVDRQNNIVESFQSLFGKEELLAKVIECFPYPIQIFSLDGTARMINKATLEMIGIKSVESHVGKYNVFEDPIVRELGVMDQVRQVLAGKTVYLTDFNAPYQDMIRFFNVEDRDIQTISSDITCFPLVNADGMVEYFAAVSGDSSEINIDGVIEAPDYITMGEVFLLLKMANLILIVRILIRWAIESINANLTTTA